MRFLPVFGAGQEHNLGRMLLGVSVLTRLSVLLLLITFAGWTEYSNLKLGYNNSRLVELSDGKAMRWFYEASDAFLGIFGEPEEVVKTNGGMTWSIRVMGVPFTDPTAATSLLIKNRNWPLGFALGLIIPVGLALVFGRVFCSYVCPASLLFFTINRVRRLLSFFFYFPSLKVPRGVAWGLFAGGLAVALWFGHGIWAFLLPYFAVGQTLFAAVAFGTLSATVLSIIVFALADLTLGSFFTCRNLCPTGRILGKLGARSLVSVRRDADRCVDSCQSCTLICPLQADPKIDDTQDCSLCGECLIVCPTKCLTVGTQ
jgi:ferredoxin-type protein NapH